MNNKCILVFLALGLLIVQPAKSACGGCEGDKKGVKSAFIEEIPPSGRIKGKALASCGMCNFDTDDKSCGLSVKIGHHIYNLANVNIDDHIDSHAKDGFCNVVRVVNIVIGNYDPSQSEFNAADLNNDGIVNVLDIITLVNLILS